MDFERERVGDPGKGRECMCVRDREHAYNNQVVTFGKGIPEDMLCAPCLFYVYIYV